MPQQTLKKFNLQIHGMTCAACEVAVERKFKTVPGVVKVSVNHRTGKTEVLSTEPPRLEDFRLALAEEPYEVAPYRVGAMRTPCAANDSLSSGTHLSESGAIVLLVAGIVFFLSRLGVLKGGFGPGISDSMGYGVVFVLGLVAAASTCIAVTGGLLLAVAGRYAEHYPNLSGIEKLKPHLAFNAGRLLSYAVLGGAVGALGSAFAFSPRLTGMITVATAAFMIVMALGMLKIFSWASRFTLHLPKFLGHKIHGIGERPGRFAPFLLGAATFFLPCGFTQALQLYALSTGSFTKGALTMFVFALGTLPALLSLGAVSSFIKGPAMRLFVKFAGAFVLVLGVYNIENGLALTGSNFSLGSMWNALSRQEDRAAEALNDPNVTLKNGTQIVRMAVDRSGYNPNHFTIYEGMPVQWLIWGEDARGCASVLTVPRYGITKYLRQGVENEIRFTPDSTGEVRFSCTMGMFTGSFTVIPRPTGLQAARFPAGVALAAGNESDTGCDPSDPSCDVQVATMRIGHGGYEPREIIVRNGKPVQLTVEDDVPLGGCMGTIVIPEYNVAKVLRLGKNVLAFTPTRAGTFPITCAMGSRMAQLTVVE